MDDIQNARRNFVDHALVFLNYGVQYHLKPAASAGREGTMDELIARLVANVGVDKSAAEKAVGIILAFLRKDGPPDKVQVLIDKLPGAEQLLQAQEGIGGA